ncbi:MAG: hypothetical protein RSG51_01815 [Bacilli bacterium]
MKKRIKVNLLTVLFVGLIFLYAPVVKSIQITSDIGGSSSASSGSGGGTSGGNGPKYALASLSLVKASLVDFTNEIPNVIYSVYYANPGDYHYNTRFASTNKEGAYFACGFMNEDNYSSECRDVKDNILETEKMPVKKWIFTDGSAGLNFSAEKAGMFFSVAKNVQTLLDVVNQKKGTTFNILKEKFTDEETKQLNNLKIVVEPVYDFEVKDSNHQYIFATVKGISKILSNDDDFKSKAGYELGTLIDHFYGNVYSTKKYGIINKDGTDPMKSINEIINMKEKYAYISLATNGAGYGILSLAGIPEGKPDDGGGGPDVPPKEGCNLDTIGSVPKDCNDSVQGTISEPSICAKMNPNNKKKPIEKEYEYTITSLKTNGTIQANFATTYCQEIGTYNFFDKTEAEAGRYFKYDINNDKKNYIASFKGTINCVSKINYQEWKRLYDVALDNVRIKFNNYNYYNSLNENGYITSSINGCNGGSCYGSCFAPDTTSYYWNAKYYNINDYWKKEYSNSSASSLGTASSCSYSTTCKGHCNKVDEKGKCIGYGPDICCGGGCSYGSNGDSSFVRNQLNSALKQLEDSKKVLTTLEGMLLEANHYDKKYIKKITDYSISSNDKSFKYEDKLIKDGVDISIGTEVMEKKDIPTTYSSENMDYLTICPSCDTDILSKINGANKTEKYKNGYKTIVGVESVDLPTNSFAYKRADVELYFYQSNEFYTEAFTGKISNKPYGENIENWTKIEDRVFPLDINIKDGTKLDVDFKYKSTLEDRLDKNKNMVSGNYHCMVDIKNDITRRPDGGGDGDGGNNRKEGLGYIYRSVDLKNLFPNSGNHSYNRQIGRNWVEQNGDFVKIKKDIEDFEKKSIIYNKKPQYTVVLTPENVKKIKTHNNKVVKYDNNSVSCKENLGICTSNFLTDKNGNSILKINKEFQASPEILKYDATDGADNFYYYHGGTK